MTNFTRKMFLILAFMASYFGVKAQTDTLAFDTDISKPGYALATVTIGNYDWNLFQAIQANPADANDVKFGANSIRMRRNNADYGYIEMNEDKATGLGSISFYASRANFNNDRTGNAPIFEAQYSTDQGANWTPAGTAVDLTGVDVLTKYEFPNLNISGNVRIRLIVTGGDSGKRFNIDSLIFTSYAAPAACEAPTNLVLTDNQDGSLTASWTAPATLPAIGYYIAVVPTGNTPTQADYFTAASSATIFTTDTLKNGTALADGSTYDVYVMAVCAHGAGGYATPIQDDVAITIAATPSCAAPTNLVVTDNGNGSVTASWTAPATLPAIGYYIAVVPAGNTPAQADYFTAASSATTFTTDTLKNGTALADGSTYDVHVMAVCTHGAGGYATPIQDDVTITISSASCQDPANITITDNGNGSVNVSWTAPATAPQNGYYYAVVPQGTTPSVPNDYVNTSATSLTNINATTLAAGSVPLTGGTTYTFHLRSFCFHGAGGYGNEFENDFTLTLGVNDIHSEISGVYPNPAETTLTIDTKAEEGTISIVDLTGKTIATSAIKGNSTTISVSDLPGGMYQVVLSTSNTTSISKFVKK